MPTELLALLDAAEALAHELDGDPQIGSLIRRCRLRVLNLTQRGRLH